jgi:alpha-1,6-mannosyltransferase
VNRSRQIPTGGVLLLLGIVGITIVSRWFPYGDDFNKGPLLTFLALYVLCWIGYVATVVPILRGAPAVSVRTVFIVAIVARLALLGANPILENDFYRYIWDGHVVLAGINPYSEAPEYMDVEDVEPDPVKLDAARIVQERVNYAWVKTIYPPAAQAVFALEAWLFGWRVDGFKFLCFGIELIVLWLMWRLVLACKLPPATILIYAWNPLLLKEINNSQHIDIVCTLLLALMVLALTRERVYLAATALSLAVLVKLTPIVLAPLVCFYLVKQRRRWQALGSGALFCVLTALGVAVCFAGIEVDPLSGLKRFAGGWEINSPIFPLLRGGFDVVGFGTDAAANAAKILSVIGLGVFVMIGFRFIKDEQSLWRWSVWTLMLLFLISPVGNPWYLAWMMPFVLITRHVIAIALMSVMVLYYFGLSLVYGIVPPIPGLAWIHRYFADWLYHGVVAVEYGLFIAFTVWCLRKRRHITDAESGDV